MEPLATEQDDTVDDEAQESSDTRLQIASLLATLSESMVAPSGVQDVIALFHSGDVDFTSNAWLLRVLAVQGWLGLDDTISASVAKRDPEAAAIQLCRYLGLADDPKRFVSVQQGQVVLAPEAEEALVNRLERAVQRRDMFLQMIEDGESQKIASQRWAELWEDEPEPDAVVDPIHAEVTTFTMLQVKDMAVTGKLNLSPTYQRGDVWTTPDAQALIVSILSGIPLPSIIILKSDKGKVYEIVDGKQRLTSILRFMGQHPAAIESVKRVDDEHGLKGALVTAFQNDYPAFRRKWRKVLGKKLGADDEALMYFPFALPKLADGRPGVVPRELRALAGKYYTQIKDDEVDVAQQKVTIEDIFVGAAPPYKLPMIVYHNAKPRQIHHVFNLYNRQGKHLNAEEIRNALFHEVPLARLMLAAAGDSKDPGKLLGFLAGPSRGELPAEALRRVGEIGTALDAYKFGDARYKRTKVLSWLCALLLEPALTSDGLLSVRSTAKHIDALFKSAQKSGRDVRLGDPRVLAQLLEDLHAVIAAHSSMDDVWSPSFKRGKEGAWQELPLVASLAATFLIHVSNGDAEQTLAERGELLREYTTTRPPLKKAQNKTQWAFIGSTVLKILALTGIDQAHASQRLQERYGQDCLPTLTAANVAAAETGGE